MIKNKQVLLGVTGGIAAYKAVELASKLTKAGAVVKTIMTKNAAEFVSPLTFRSITHQAVVTKMFDIESDIEHISLADWADIIVIAPATANVIGKIASGIADDLLTTTVIASTAPKVIVPAMNIYMYENPIVRSNISRLEKVGYFFMEPEYGKLACGYEGLGRYPQNEEIIFYLKSYLHYKKDLKGKSILVSAGASLENIDPMRYITNHSSGKMGLAIARAAHIRGADVKLVYSKVSENIPEYLEAQKAVSAQKMFNEITAKQNNFKAIFMIAAVADYTPAEPQQQKIKKDENLALKLKRTKDILKYLGENKPDDQLLIGFAAESENIIENAKNKLINKNLDFICANNLSVSGKDNTEITIIGEKNEKKIVGDKFMVAHKIIDQVFSKQ